MCVSDETIRKSLNIIRKIIKDNVSNVFEIKYHILHNDPFYTLEDLKPHLSYNCVKNERKLQGLPISRHVNFDFGNSSKNPDELLLLDK